MAPSSVARIASGLTLLLSLVSPAEPLPVGSTASLSGATLETHPEWAGIVQNDNLIPWEIQNNLGTVIMSGTIQNRVSQSNTDGNLVIAPRLRDLTSPTGTARIVRYTTQGFGDLTLDVDVRLDGSGDRGPETVTRSTAPGSDLVFEFGSNLLTPPESGRFVMISTDTPVFALDGSATISAEESPGGALFSVQVNGTARPVLQQRLNLRSLTRDDLGQLTLVWDATPGSDYEIQRSSDGVSWFSFRSKMATSTTGFDTFTPSAGDVKFYRVVLP